jgi:hypothetical protein
MRKAELNGIARDAERSEVGLVDGASQLGFPAAAIRKQLKKLLSSPLFSKSDRYPAFLRYVVDSVIRNPTDKLKEQTVGIEVFGKTPGYDTSRDHIVRSTAVEIRKRLKEYYRQPDYHDDIVIDLPIGSYTPRIYHRKDLTFGYVIPPASGELEITVSKRFWNPIWRPDNSVIVCIAPLSRPDTTDPAINDESIVGMHFNDRHRVALADAISMSRVVAFIASHGGHPEMRGSDQLTFSDFQQHSVTLIGALNNKWACNLTNSLRYTFGFDEAAGKAFIRDEESLGQRIGEVTFSDRAMDLKEDFAIVTRLNDPSIGKPVLALGGITILGTSAAVEFATNPKAMSVLKELAPDGWAEMNLQLLLNTRIVEGRAGPARLSAWTFWRG